MGKWFPRVYDFAMKPLEQTKFKSIRQHLVGNVEGRVLEIGSGTGVNFPHYKTARQVDAIEPNPLMRNHSLRNNSKSKVPIHTYLAGAENLPFADNTFDTVVATLVFCTISDPLKAFQEIQRVSKPGAKILLFEHVRVPQSFISTVQDILTPFWKRVCDGCHLNRDTLKLVEQTGLTIFNKQTYFNGIFVTIKCINEK